MWPLIRQRQTFGEIRRTRLHLEKTKTSSVKQGGGYRSGQTLFFKSEKKKRKGGEEELRRRGKGVTGGTREKKGCWDMVKFVLRIRRRKVQNGGGTKSIWYELENGGGK